VILVTCLTCGDQSVTADDLVLEMCLDNMAITHAFRCEQCGLITRHPTPPAVIEELKAAGVMVTAWMLPDEVYEAHQGGPITKADLDAFHNLMRSDDWFARLQEMTER
jgi:hypothetical protein